MLAFVKEIEAFSHVPISVPGYTLREYRFKALCLAISQSKSNQNYRAKVLAILSLMQLPRTVMHLTYDSKYLISSLYAKQ